MKPKDFRPWAEEQLAKSPSIASVKSVQDDRPGHDYITYTHVTFPTGAKVIISWTSTDQVGGPNRNPDGSIAFTGPPPEPVPVPDLPTSGRLKTLDVEKHLAALLHNGGHERVAKASGYHDQVNPFGEDRRRTQYGVKVAFHSGEEAFGLLDFTLRPGQQPTEQLRYEQLDEI